MSTNIYNYISKSLSIKDENITFLNNIYTKKINKLNNIVHDAVLSYNSTFYPKFGSFNHSHIIKHGFKDAFVRLSSINGQPTAIKLKN